MATNATRTQQDPVNAVVQAALGKEAVARRAEGASSPADAPRRPSGYGLPCAKCHLYYPADLDVCPTCKHRERVSPVVPRISAKAVQAEAEPIPDTALIEQEREEFLRQFKSQLLEAHAEIANGPESVCKFGEHHTGEPASAEVCNSCYERVQERLDVFEAALHLELKEAAQIIYDAVWADPSDPGKTYQNAASALLTELRKRAGMTTVLGPFQPLTH
ncbi:MAG: hypothetical protein DMG79_17840 [Acidobacteria bacterium]|nr:MAG: hypothetical protein DMG79_17840 [Acidobacteriota bacterium]